MVWKNIDWIFLGRNTFNDDYSNNVFFTLSLSPSQKSYWRNLNKIRWMICLTKLIWTKNLFIHIKQMNIFDIFSKKEKIFCNVFNNKKNYSKHCNNNKKKSFLVIFCITSHHIHTPFAFYRFFSFLLFVVLNMMLALKLSRYLLFEMFFPEKKLPIFFASFCFALWKRHTIFF